MGTVLVVDTTQEFASGIATLVAPHEHMTVRHVTSTRLSAIEEIDAHVIVVGATLDPQAGLDLASRLSGVRRPSAVLVVDEVTTDLLRAALRAGVSDVVGTAASGAELLEAIVAAHDTAERARSERDETADDEQQSGDEGRVVTVFSTKGGVGKTVLSTCLATALASGMGLKTVLVDLDLQFGDVAIMLGLEPTRTIADAVHSFDRLDADMLSGYLSEHASGLRVLLAPTRPEDAETITAGRISAIIGLLRHMFDVVVIDTSASLDETVLAALDASADVFAVTMMDVASIKNTRISLQKLEQLGYASDGSPKLVLNRADSKVWLEPQEVEKALGRPIYARIPSDRLVPRSVNKGTPVVLDAPRSDVAKSVIAIARGIAESIQGAQSDVVEG